MTELEMKLFEVRRDLMNEMGYDLESMKKDPRIKELRKEVTYQTGYGKTDHFYFSLSIPSIIESNDNGNKTNT